MTAPNRTVSILVASDLTDASTEALRSAAELAASCDGDLHVVHAYEEPSAMSRGNRDLLAIQQNIHDLRKKLYDQVASVMPEGKVAATARVEIGASADVILAAVTNVSADVVVLGAHRSRGVADRFLGSTAERVLRTAAIPCLMLNQTLSLPISKIVVPCDFSAPASRALRAALLWGRRVGAESKATLRVVHVMDPNIESDQAQRAQQEVEGDLRNVASAAAGETETDLPVEVAVLRGGDPSKLLIDDARSSGAGLIVMGTHGDGVLVRALLGSVSSAMVRQSAIPVMLVPPAAESGPADDREQSVNSPQPVVI